MACVFRIDTLIAIHLYCGNVLKVMNGWLPFTGLKMLENGAHIAQKINLTLLTMLNGLQIIKMENAFQKIILIVYYHCSGDVLKDMNGIQHLET